MGSELPLGTIIGGRYAIVEELGRGGSASVFRAHDSQLGRDVALKLLHPELSEAVSAERFAREISLTTRLQHPHILPALDSGRWQGRLYYVMQLVDGETLEQRLARERQLPLDVVVRIAKDVGDALAFAHSLGVVHRDVKPSNVLLSTDHAWLCDFGVARAIRDGDGDRMTTSGVVVGTVAYMSPEQASADRNIDARSDIYSLGCVIYEALAGVRPFAAADEARSLALRMISDAPPLSLHRPALSADVVDAIARAMERAPADRWQSVSELIAALSQAGDGPARAIQRPDSRGARARGVSGERRSSSPLRWAAAIGLVLIVSVIGALAWRSRSGQAAVPDDSSDETVALALVRSGDSRLTAEERQFLEAVGSSLGAWKDVAVVALGDDAAASGGRQVFESAQRAEAAARRRGAGMLIAIQPNGSGAAAKVSMLSRDLRSGRIARATESLGAASPADVGALAGRISRDALRQPTAPWIDDDPGATQSVRALRRFQRGSAQLARWDLAGAIREFESALALDPDYALAHLWSAQARAWQSTEPSRATGWRDEVVRATLHQERLGERARRHASGLRALADGRPFDAATVFRRMLAVDSLDFVAWSLLGESVARDSALVADRRSPSGWRFRASIEEAVRAYRNVLDVAPAAALATFYGKTIEIIPLRASTSRTGWTTGSAPPKMMMALPSLESDTLAYFPYSLEDFASARSGTIPRSLAAAVDHGREARQALAKAWLARDPSSPNAHFELAQAMESLGEIGPSSAGNDALAVLVRGIALDSVASTRAQAGNALVRLRIKRREFTQARRAADSLLSHARFSDPKVAGAVAPIAALLGLDSLASALLARSWSVDGELPTVGRLRLPTPMIEPMAHHLVSVALGRCDGLAAADARLTGQLASFFEPAMLAEARETILGQSRRVAATCGDSAFAGLLGTSGDPLDELLRAALRTDSVEAKRARVRVLEIRTGARPSDYSWDAVLCETWALQRVGLRREAAQLLDEALEGLFVSDGAATRDVMYAASLVRSLQLRSDLAAAGFKWRDNRWSEAARLFASSKTEPVTDQRKVTR